MNTPGFDPYVGKRAFRNRARLRQRSGASVGVILIAVGALLLLSNMGIIRVRDIFEFWPLIPMAWGVQAILRGKSIFSYLVGGLAVMLSGLKLLDNLDIINIGAKFYAPIILITLGVAFLARNFTECGETQGDSTVLPKIHPVAIFGGVKRRIESSEFEGGEMMAVFGGVDLDFRKAKMKGETATLEVNAVFGGCSLRVPENWLVEMRGVAMFGGFEDKTMAPRPGDGPPQKLIVTGNAVFGGVTVEN